MLLKQRYECSQPEKHPEQLERCAKLATEIEQNRMDRIVISFLLTLFLLVQSCLAVAEYSGYQNQPMFGDFEAQRHWMELTVNLPTSQWYNYDSEYWGLDYPPLTAYHSWILGKISQQINITWVELYKSRGIELPEHKLFMRLSVIITMMAFYAPAIVLLFLKDIKRDQKHWQLNLAQSLLYPGLLFIDSAHFQYNHCSLAFFLWTIFAIDKEKFAFGSLLFVFALNHKQMELYHALPIFVFLFARSIQKCSTLIQTMLKGFLNLFKLAFIVLITFFILWLPFILPDPSISIQVIKRLFPVDRGLFEDKVANFWCTASILVKFKQIYETTILLKASAFLVLLSSTPSLFCLFLRPNQLNFRCSLVVCALNFFLFSFQVHEKSILLVAIPAFLLLNQPTMRRPISLFLSISCFSLYSLCLKDNVPEMLPMFTFYNLLNFWIGRQNQQENGLKMDGKCWQIKFFHWLELILSFFAHFICLIQLFFQSPAHYPHLFPLLNAFFSFICFFAFYFWLNFEMLKANCNVWKQQQWRWKNKKF